MYAWHRARVRRIVMWIAVGLAAAAFLLQAPAAGGGDAAPPDAGVAATS